MTDADYADDLTLLANAPAEADSQLHSLEQPAGSIGFCANAKKNPEYIVF